MFMCYVKKKGFAVAIPCYSQLLFHFPSVSDGDNSFWLSTIRPLLFNCLDESFSVSDSTKNDVSSVKPRARDCRDKKLTRGGIWIYQQKRIQI